MELIDNAKFYNKLLWRVIPLPLLLYLFNNIDRSNISFAALTMNKDLGISSIEFGTITSVFFITYLLFQVPLNMLLKKIGARKVISTIVLGWGLVTTLTFFVQNSSQLIICRIFLGMFEAGFFAGIIYWISLWFPNKVRAKATSIFYLGYTGASIIGPPLAGSLVQYATFYSIAGWRWMYLIEGLPVVVLAILAFFLMKDSPEKANWLTAEEKALIWADMEADKRDNPENKEKPDWRKLITNKALWKLSGIYCFICAGSAAAMLWLPTLFKDIASYLSPSAIGFIMMVPSILGAGATIIVGNHSDKTGERKWHLLVPLFGFALSFVLFILPFGGIFYKTVALLLYGITYTSYLGVFWTLPGLFVATESLAVSIAVINSLNGAGSFFANILTGYVKTYFGPMGVFALFAGLILFAAVLVFTLDFKKAKDNKIAIQPEEVA